MKTALYAATVARTYRKAIDDYMESEEKYQDSLDWYRREIAKCTYRQYTTGFYFGRPDEKMQIYEESTYVKEYIYLGVVQEVDGRGRAKIQQKNKFCVGDTIEIMKPGGSNEETRVLSLETEEGQYVDSAPHSKQVLFVELAGQVSQYDILRMAAPEKEAV